MTLADEIREHIDTRHLKPARSAGADRLTLRAGDIHREMNLASRMPAVCSVLGGARLEELAGVQLVERDGPQQGANVYFTYVLSAGLAAPLVREAAFPPVPARAEGPTTAAGEGQEGLYDFGQALVLISCTKSKMASAARAADLYTSSQFRLAKQLVEQRDLTWRILSAKHGLLSPDEWIKPYDETLNSMPVARRRTWSDRVLVQLVPLAREHGKAVFLAGVRYREFLVPGLSAAGIESDAPMARLRQGRQLAWLSAR